MKYLLRICYDGSAYAGFQFQTNAETVQGKLTEAARKLFGIPCDITGCSRTDAGVHAAGFAATVSPRAADGVLKVAPERVPAGMNFYLPEDIAVLSAERVPDAFHARYSVVSKTYEYRIVNSEVRNPLLRGRAYMPGRRLSEEAVRRMHWAAQSLVGTHDFRAYMSAGSSVTDTVRTVLAASVASEGGCIVFRISADGFLYNMVRILAGTLYAVGCGRIAPEAVSGITASGNRKNAGETLPPEGLTLVDVAYPSTQY